MKKLLLIVIVLFFSTISVLSQVLVDTAKIWSTGLISYNKPIYSYFIKFEGDTLINSVSYFKVWESWDEYQSEWRQWGYIREEDKRVFYLFDTDGEEKLIYDFNIEPGDNIYFENVGYLKVDSIVNKTICNEAKNCYYLSLIPYPGQVIWCEGIGSLSGILNSEGNIALTGGLYTLLCFTENDTLKYSDPNYNTCYFKDVTNFVDKEGGRQEIKIYPNPSTGKFFLQVGNTTTKEFKVSIFDITGKLVFQRNYKNNKLIEINSLINTKGIYNIQVIGDKLLYSARIVIN